MRGLFLSLALTAAALSVGGCDIPDEDNIEVGVQVDDVQIALAPTTFGKQIQGTFTLTAILGELAQDPTTVKWEKVALVNASSNEELLSVPISAKVAPSVAVPKGTTQTIAFTIETSVVDAAATTALCAAPLRVAITVFDSAKAKPKSATSMPFSLPGCP